ncbi:MAG: adenosine deaminase [Anaerolineae bacterium]|nr:adenosine deaminase [Anaerolineae bacterium]
MELNDFIRQMPKAEIHVHMEGSIRPETLLKLARKNNVELPSDTVEGLRRWYTFTDFDHFISIYIKISECIQTPDDIELIAREFLEGQAAQNIRYSEVTYTAHTHYEQKGIPFDEQLAALNRARAWGEQTLGVRMNTIIDISRHVDTEVGLITAKWAVEGMGQGVVALGLGGPEVNNPPERFGGAFQFAADAGLPGVPHAGETEGPASIWGSLRALKAVRIGHGVRCLEDSALVDELRERQVPLEVCPTSNVCLKVFPDFASHPLPRLLDEGLYVTLNSDDPPLFNTTLTNEYLQAAAAFGFDEETLRMLVLNAVRAALLPAEEKQAMLQVYETEFEQLGKS